MDQRVPVAIVTDSGTSLPAHIVERYQISVVPFYVHVGTHTYRDGVDLTPPAFFAMLRAQEEPDVSTSVPSVGQFVEVYEKVAEWADAILSIHLTSEQSGTHDTAQLAAKESPVPITVLDTETTAMGEGFVVLEAARAAQERAPLEEIVAKARTMLPSVGVIALLEDVGYAVRGGRLASAARLLGSVLRIQPLVQVSGNKVGLAGQARRRRSGLEQLKNRILQLAGDAPAHLTVHYAEDRAEGEGLLETLKQQLNCVEAYLTHIPVALGAHAGPGSIGVSYYVEGGLQTEERAGIRKRLTSLLRDED
jgi:DegV family protein with EDD domain